MGTKKTLEERKSALQNQLSKVNSQIKAKQAREKERKRKEDTRRKIILGGLCETHMRSNTKSDFTRVMARLIQEYTISDNDRALFKLPPLTTEEQAARQQLQKSNRKRKQA